MIASDQFFYADFENLYDLQCLGLEWILVQSLFFESTSRTLREVKI